MFPGWMTSLLCDYSAQSPQPTAGFSIPANVHGKASLSAYFHKFR
jgi:hypothetical protein